ncbi:undecaprenyl/decaprenyl-phosphate alpha-N-acetylglucosaminyl 1-phosphate transferase [Flavihumibacter rivuli]|uniref:MraY family glycosyltransferase n=1 Tax=Flavihumibacter rivuli TaxID=2838156 RepID=UPI001BDEC2C7|nr:MraY family glycosyltransferase [Flavihumibacter rivuli]ULQ55035.1 undecaprenyl/decaprenyl-phosphate alpha-N-acetylglucosaminyl 1-phosphate transferase [Flavihumibacter rivuli]
MFDVILALTISFAVSFLAIPVIIRVAAMKKLFDIPDERKVHQSPIPSLGGLGIFAGFAFATLLIANFSQGTDIQYFLAAAVVIFYLGLKDDILIISPLKKFIGQVLAAFIIIYMGNLQIHSMHGFLGIYSMPESFSLLFSYLTVIVIINSFNLIDGVDGLAGSLGLLSTAVFGIYFVSVGQIADAVLAFSMAGSILAFLIFNFQPARIFMGDTGSMLIGLISAVLVIKFINTAGSTETSLPIAAAPAVGFAILMVPLLDTLRVFGIRIFQRRSPFSPDRNHIHHLLLDNGMNHRNIAISLLSFNVLAIGLAFLMRNLGSTLLMAVIFSIFFSAIGVMYYLRQRRTPRMFVTSVNDVKNGTAKKVVPLTEDAVLQQK